MLTGNTIMSITGNMQTLSRGVVIGGKRGKIRLSNISEMRYFNCCSFRWKT